MRFRSAFVTALAGGAALGLALSATGKQDLNPIERPTGILADATAAVSPATWDIPMVWNNHVERFVDIFSGRGQDRMALYLTRSGRYEPMIRGKLRERGMPEDLLYLSMIESGFNTTARSHAQAVGLWQFIAETGRRYGLRVDGHVDERRHPEKSTDAALGYLSDLYDMFGSWYLAAAAYNTGENRVARIMREETGSVKGTDDDFWRIRHRLPAETREYVPLMLAAAFIGKEPEKYGLIDVKRWVPVETETVPVPGGTRLALVGAAVGVAEAEIQRLNPHLLRDATPPGGDYPVYVPRGRSVQYAANFDAVAKEAAEEAKVRQAAAQARQAQQAQQARAAAAARARARTHTVRNGESLWTIARRHNTSVRAIQRANGMGTRSVIRPGQRLRLPG
jgi:membrane-bound lytic murein transglycosylase D